MDSRTDPKVSAGKDNVASDYLHNTDAPRVNTDGLVFQRLQKLYPDKEITIVPESSCNLLAYAAAGHATAVPESKSNGTQSGPLQWHAYVPAATRLGGGSGQIATKVLFGKYKYSWGDYQYILYLVEGRDGTESWPAVRNNYIVSDTSNSVLSLMLAVGYYDINLHGEIWVFDQGYWQKDAALWASIQKSRWEDVILDPDMKKAIIGDVNRFYGGEDEYKRLRVPWKRGIIFHGPPGNGKTISIKATMHMLYDRQDPVPTLYVKTLSSFAGPEYSLNLIFGKARASAPCYLVFEDLDSIVSDSVRSFFLNQVDGLSDNDGIMMVGSTNHLELLDPGISKRPSRFDRKYLFPNPNFEERTLYAEFWRKKLLGGEAKEDDLGGTGGLMDEGDKIEFPEEMCKPVASITDGFSFAYIQEAFVATLMMIVADEKEKFEEMTHDFGFIMIDEARNEVLGDEKSGNDDKDELDKLILWREFKKQVKLLREEMGDAKAVA